MRNADVVRSYMNNSDQVKGSNLYVEGRALINYTTTIAYRVQGQPIILNGDSYSPTTSVHQNQIRRSGAEYVEVTEEVMNRVVDTQDFEELAEYHIKQNEKNVG